ncbi:MAG: 2-hydroxyglutaryl-CoA dehydratase [Ruminococcaceae bacterium]|nr:2-hydroxyglutaryl-CoA dehydratase [Oscillospiraceae bacterium]
MAGRCLHILKRYRVGVDVGSTTIKVILLDENNEIIYKRYERHCARIQETMTELLVEARSIVGKCILHIRMTGSGAINLAKALETGFVQEVAAVAVALKEKLPQTDVAIELGGEDAKIIYFDNGIEERMNGVCAGGTGAFIDQMAALLQTDAKGLDDAAKKYKQIYPIAARCGVFAKTDIQPLINEGAAVPDLAASIFQAVVNQTISGLACGRPIRGCVAFLGGPLHFLPELKKAFARTLELTPDKMAESEDSHLFAAFGAALNADEETGVEIDAFIEKMQQGIQMQFEIKRLDPLFESESEYKEFCDRHSDAVVFKKDISEYRGKCFLGIDAGSTTTKMALIGEAGELLFSYYANNRGNPIHTAIDAMVKLGEKLPDGAEIVRSCSTGYGEALLKTAFSLDIGEVETVAHCTAATFFDCDADCILDIGGQDMKFIRLKNGVVDNVILNEACSSGCGSFIENFAASLGYDAEGFANEALYAENPVDLGTRCTVFMNSNVKQAQKEGASVSDISAGLAYSVIKNALFKVIKLGDVSELGNRIVVQGGTFYNHAVLRAFEKVSGKNAVCPDISGIMGAFGAALIAKNGYTGQKSSMLSFEDIATLTYKTKVTRCSGCTNNCILTINDFGNGRRHITGNRCEKGIGEKQSATAPNLVQYKRERIFAYEPLSEEDAFRGTIGIPRVLNIYENFPFWATFWKELGFKVVLSPFSDRRIYELGMESIPSESECYPAKLAHGHIEWLIKNGIKTIFYPCVYYEKQETEAAQNHYNCPIVVSYPENIKNNVEEIADGDVDFVRPFVAFTDEKTVADRLVMLCCEKWQIAPSEILSAVKKAWEEMEKAKRDILEEGKRVLAEMEEKGECGIVIAGRPYHIDPEINHGIPELISSFGLTVFTEDSVPVDFVPTRPLRVVDQWVYHSRLYNAAEFVSTRDDLELIQFNSFGCGLDAVTTDQVCEILEKNNKLYTLLKIDEVNNLGAARIRIRSLVSAMKMRGERGIKAEACSGKYNRVEFTKKMFDENYTILAPQMSPIHFDILRPIFEKAGYNVVVLDNDNRSAIDVGLKFVNNDACFPSITVVGQIMEAVLSGKYDTDKLAVMVTQTGGCCRASNYVGFIRKALAKANLSHIPVISLNANGMEKNEGFKPGIKMIVDAAKAIVYGDLLMRCLYRVRPYEKVTGDAERLLKKWSEICVDSLVNPKSEYKYKKVCYGIVRDFDSLPIDETVKKPRVGIVGEILVKYMPLANNHLVELLEKEGAEVVVPDLMDFMNYTFYNAHYKTEFLGEGKASSRVAKIAVALIQRFRRHAIKALGKSKRFEAPEHISELAERAKPFLSLGNQYGEGWFLTGEMAKLVSGDVPNVICVQPFACLPNHVVGKGVIKAMKKAYPEANIVAVDYDPGASEVNQLNRIKLMLTTAKEKLK